MIFHQHIKTQQGEIWILDSVKNDFIKIDEEPRQEFEARVLKTMIQYILGDVNLDHNLSGAPFIQNRPEITLSISHSVNWFALYVSKKHGVGLDLEINSGQIKKTKNYFLTDTEIEKICPDSSELQICWGIKEALYKLVQGDIQSFKNDIEIMSIENNQALAKVKSEDINLNYLQTDIFTLVYTK